jgi:hypothetical protein
MCLSSINKRKPKPEGVGYKVFVPLVHANAKITSVASVFYPIHYRFNRWYKARKENVQTEDSKEIYKTGFHIFLTRWEATRYACGRDLVRKVQYRKARLLGKQDPYVGIHAKLDCLVADEMRIPELKRKPTVK